MGVFQFAVFRKTLKASNNNSLTCLQQARGETSRIKSIKTLLAEFLLCKN
jgi:hypothetical protein